MEQFVHSTNSYRVMTHVQLVGWIVIWLILSNKTFAKLEFHNIDPHLFRRVLAELEKRGQATVFSDNGVEGVKFS